MPVHGPSGASCLRRLSRRAAIIGWCAALLAPLSDSAAALEAPWTPEAFIRGDASLDGALDISDPILLLVHLFRGGTAPPCLDAADADDDGVLGISDAIAGLGRLFTGGPGLPAPFPDPGRDPTPDLLACDPYPADAAEQLPGDPGAPFDEQSGPAGVSGPVAAAAREASPNLFFLEPRLQARLAALPAGSSPRLAIPELAPWIDAMLRGLGGAAAVQAVGRPLLAPADAGGCWEVDARLLDGGSRPRRASGAPFLRGDVTRDGSVDGADLEAARDCFLNLGGRAELCAADCPAAWDLNDDGNIDLADLGALADAVLEDGALPEPRSCGPDPTPDGLQPCRVSACTGAGPEASGWSFRAEPARICGPGLHVVLFTARDPQGNEAALPVPIRLCDSQADAGCPEVPEGGGPEIEGGDSSIACRWIGVEVLQPAEPETERLQKSFSSTGSTDQVRVSPPFSGRSPMVFAAREEGPGPLHHLYTSRHNASCNTPRETLEREASGLIEVRINLFCIDGGGLVASPPCEAAVEAEAIYRAEVAIQSEAGSPCLGFYPPVESLAQEEARFLMGGSEVFSKSLSLQNGNAISIRPSYRFGAGLTIGNDSLPAASLGVGFGISQQVSQRYGSESSRLNASGGRLVAPPATVALEVYSRSRSHGEGRTGGRAIATTRAAGLWMAGRSSCPEAGYFILKEILGREDEVRDAEERAQAFFRTRLGF